MNAKIFCKRTSALLLAIVLLAMASPADAQCVMCKAVAEDSAADGGLGAGLNKGHSLPHDGALHFVIRPFFRNL
jgi:hypothetical protein